MAKASKRISLSEWLATVDLYLKRMRKSGKTDEEIAQIQEWFVKATNDVFRAPVRSLDDLVVRAAVACHWNSNLDADRPPYPEFMLDGDPRELLDQRSLAHVVKGILDLAGLKLDNEGRLVSGKE